VLADLPWKTRPPVVGGYNRFVPKTDATLLLNAITYNATWDGERHTVTQTTIDPMLVVGQQGAGRTAALATDVAPHWVGPLVDWGDARVSAQACNANAIEVGNLYAQFFKQLLLWAAGNDAGRC